MTHLWVCGSLKIFLQNTNLRVYCHLKSILKNSNFFNVKHYIITLRLSGFLKKIFFKILKTVKVLDF